MKHYKAIVSDFDGTLADHTRQLTPTAKAAIKKYVQVGGIFSIATGRAYQGVVENVCKELGLSDLVIVRGGSEIISSATNQVVWGRYIRPSTVSELITFLRKEKKKGEEEELFFAAERGADIYSRDGKSQTEFGHIAPFKNIDQMPVDTVPKIIVPPIFPIQTIEPLLEKLLHTFKDLHIVKTTSKYGVGIDINDGGAGKHIALLEYAKLMRLDPSEIIGVGDSYNDYPLLTACGLKVAMGNAPPELKEIADKIVASQENDGIIEVLELMDSLI